MFCHVLKNQKSLPLYWLHTILGEVCVAARELMLAKPPAPVGRQRRGVNALKHEVLLAVYHVGLAAGIASPEHVDQVLAAAGQGLDGSIGEILPAQA